MQKKYWGIIVAIYLLNNCVFGQSLDSTLTLHEVQVIAQKDKYLVGSKIETIDSLKLEAVSGGSLADIINNYLAIYVKQDAGGLATIRFRGTSPDHTAIMFNGININSLTLGHSNISNIPAFLFDDVEVQYGSSSSLYGTDAIGGSIHLNNKPEWDKGFSIGLQQDIASFHSYFTGLKVAYSNKKLIYSLKVFRQTKQNDFPFLNTAVKDFEKGEFVMDTTRNAALANYGFLQEMAFKILENLHAFVNVWYEDNWHQIQPNMSANYYGGSFDEIQNKHLRLVSGFKYYEGKHKITTDLGYVYDYQLYDNNRNQIISTNSFIANVNYFNTDFLKGNLNTGINYLHIEPNVYAYDGNIKENRFDVFLSYKKTFFKCLTGSLNIRESFVSDYGSKFSPSIGFNYLLLNSTKHVIDYKLSVSRSYKTPTFNDRYWYPNGNPDILPEDGINYEFNTKYQFKNKNSKIQFGLSCFYMEVDNWIQWVNTKWVNEEGVNKDIWRPKNIKKVQNKGIEINFESKYKISKIRFTSGINYSLTKAVETKGYESYSPSVGKQLIYTPEHIGRAFLSIDYKKWMLSASASYTGERYNENYKILEDYLLLNTSIEKSFQLKKHTFSFNFKINNILNKAYQNQELYAMPGRNYAISIKYSINNLKFKTHENI